MSRVVGHRDDRRLQHAILHATAIQVEHAHISLAEIEEDDGVNLLLFLVIVMIIIIFFSVTIVGLALPRFLKVCICIRKSCAQVTKLGF